jgi:hypothetical protein
MTDVHAGIENPDHNRRIAARGPTPRPDAASRWRPGQRPLVGRSCRWAWDRGNERLVHMTARKSPVSLVLSPWRRRTLARCLNLQEAQGVWGARDTAQKLNASAWWAASRLRGTTRKRILPADAGRTERPAPPRLQRSTWSARATTRTEAASVACESPLWRSRESHSQEDRKCTQETRASPTLGDRIVQIGSGHTKRPRA